MKFLLLVNASAPSRARRHLLPEQSPSKINHDSVRERHGSRQARDTSDCFKIAVTAKKIRTEQTVASITVVGDESLSVRCEFDFGEGR